MQKYFLTYPLNLTRSLAQKAVLFSIMTALLLSGCSSPPIAPHHAHLLNNRYALAQPIPPSARAHTALHAPLIQFEVQGKLGFSDGKKGGSANFVWIEDGKHFNIRLYGPFGAGAVWIQGINSQIFLTDGEGKTWSGNTPEAVLKKVTGWDIPISGLRYWLKGMPSPHSNIQDVAYVKAPEQAAICRLHPLLGSFTQDGWSIHYQGYRQFKNHYVPKALVLKRDKIRLNIIFKRWDR